MSFSSQNNRIQRLETEIAGLNRQGGQARKRAAKEREAARRKLGRIGPRTPRQQRLAREADAARFEGKAAAQEIKASEFAEKLQKRGAELRRAKARLDPAREAREEISVHHDLVIPEGEEYLYDVCLSFADEQRGYVSEVATLLKGRKYRVFYDDFEATRTWGGHLTERFDFVFRKASRRCVPFISVDYARKYWTKYEWRCALNRSLVEDGYLLPARFDDTELAGLPPAVGYIDLNKFTPAAFVDLVMEKLGPPS